MKVHAWRFGTRAPMTDLTHRLEDVLVLQGPTEEPNDFWPSLESCMGQSSVPKKVVSTEAVFPKKVVSTEVASPVSYGTRALLAEGEWVAKMEVTEGLKRSYSSKFFCCRTSAQS